MGDRQRNRVLDPQDSYIDIEVDDNGETNQDSSLIPYPDAEELSGVVNDLMEEITQVERDREEHYRKLNKYRRHRQNEVEMVQKDSPYRNSSNVSVPLSLMMGQGIYGIVKQTFENKNPFWGVKSQLDAVEARADSQLLTKYFNMISESRFDINLRKQNRTIFYEATTLGTCAVKVPWVTKQWLFKRSIGGAVVEDASSLIHEGPAVLPIVYEDLIYPEDPADMQEKDWVAQRITLNESEMLKRKGVYDNVEDIMEHPRTEPNDRQRTEAEIRGKSIGRVKEYDLLEIYAYKEFGEGEKAQVYDVIITVHEQTRTVLKQQWNNIGWRPLVPINYMFIPFATEGRGTAKTVEHMQDEVTAIHNLRIDNMKLANMRMLAVRKQSGMSTHEKIYPGKIFFLEEPMKDVNPIQLGEVYRSSEAEENMAVQYAQRAVALPDIEQGFADQTLKSRDTWHGQMLRSGKSGGLYDSIMEGIEDGFHEIGTLIFFQLSEHRDEVIAKEQRIGRLTDEEIQRLSRILSTPVQDIPHRLRFSINTTTVEQSYDAQRQNLMMLNQITTQAQQQLMPLAQMLLGPQGKQMMQQAPALFQYLNDTFVNNWKTLEKIYEFAGFDDTENYIPDITKQEAIRDLLRTMQKQMMRAQQLPQGGENGRAGEQPVQLGTGSTPQPRGNQPGVGGLNPPTGAMEAAPSASTGVS